MSTPATYVTGETTKLGRTDRFFSGLGRFTVRFRWLVIFAWVAIAVISSIALPSLGSEVNNDNTQFLPNSAPSNQAATLAAPLIGSVSKQSQIIIVAALLEKQPAGVSPAPLSAADLSAVNAEAAAARSVPHVQSSEVVGVSPDRQAARILVTTGVGLNDIVGQEPVVNGLLAKLAGANHSAADQQLGLQFHLAGPVATNVANQANSNKTGNKVQLLSLVFIVLLLLVIFRSVLAPLITLAPAGVALVVSMRLIGELGAHGLKISEITELLLIVLMLGAGTDYGLFLVYRAREELRSGMPPKEAVAHALARVGESISASAATVVFALLSLLLASFGLYHDLGVPLAVGVAVMLAAGLTLLPALLAVFGRAAFWPSKAKSARATDATGTGSDREAAGERDGWWGRVAARLVSRPARTLIVGVALFAALSVAALGYYSSGFAGALNAPAGSDEAIGNALFAQHFPAASANPAELVFHYTVPVWDNAGPLHQADQVLARSGLFRQLAGPLDPDGVPVTPATLQLLYKGLGAPSGLPLAEPADLAGRLPVIVYNSYRSLVEFVSGDGRTVQFVATLKAGSQDSTPAMHATPTVRLAVTAAATASGAQQSGVAGEAAALFDVSSTSGHDMVEIIPVAIIAIGLLLALVLRSAVAPLYLILSVGLSYLAALGLSTLLFIDIGGSGGITFVLPFLMFIFLLALGEDYNILVMTRIREEARSRELSQAVVRAIGRTGPTVTAAGMVLAGTFGVLAFEAGNGPGSGQIRDVGFGLAIGVLMDTFLVRTLLVPSTVALLGKWNWWPGQVLKAPGPEPEPPSRGGGAEVLAGTGH
jgi:RND superfamily putative drug exporter